MRVLTGVLSTALAALAAGCNTDDLLDVQDPDVVRPPTLNDPANLGVFLSSAYAEVLARAEQEWVEAHTPNAMTHLGSAICS